MHAPVPTPGPVIVQLSDLHLGSRLADGGASADDALRAALAAVDALAVPVDLLLLTGDLTDRGTAAEYAALFALLDSRPGPVLMVPGNHDDPAVLRPLLAGRQDVAASVPGVCATADLGALRVVALDSSDGGRDGGRLGPERLAWLEAELAADERPTVVAVHHPPLPIGHALLDTMFLDDGDAMGDVVARHPHVERVVCGHAHRAVALRWRGTVVTVGPSSIRAFTTAFAAGQTAGLTDEAPAFAVHAWVGGALATHVVGFERAAPGPTVARTTT